MNNWPNDKSKLTFKDNLENYWKFRNEITVSNNLVCFNNKLKVTNKLGNYLLKSLHETRI